MITAKEFINKHLGKTYKDEYNEEVMIVGISEKDIIIGYYNKRWHSWDNWDNLYDIDEIKIHSPIIKTYGYLFEDELDIIDKLLSE